MFGNGPTLKYLQSPRGAKHRPRQVRYSVTEALLDIGALRAVEATMAEFVVMTRPEQGRLAAAYSPATSSLASTGHWAVDELAFIVLDIPHCGGMLRALADRMREARLTGLVYTLPAPLPDDCITREGCRVIAFVSRPFLPKDLDALRAALAERLGVEKWDNVPAWERFWYPQQLRDWRASIVRVDGVHCGLFAVDAALEQVGRASSDSDTVGGISGGADAPPTVDESDASASPAPRRLFVKVRTPAGRRPA